MSKYSDRVIISIDLGSLEIGEPRRQALERLAELAGFTWNDKPSIGKWLISLAEQEIEKMAQQVLDEIKTIARQVAPNATVGYTNSTEGNKQQFVTIDNIAGIGDDASEAAARDKADRVIDSLNDAGFRWGWSATVDTSDGNSRIVVLGVNYSK